MTEIGQYLKIVENVIHGHKKKKRLGEIDYHEKE